MNFLSDSPLKIFVVDDEEEVRKDMLFDLEKLVPQVKSFDNCEDCLNALGWHDLGVIFIDYRIKPVASHMQGNALLDHLVNWHSPLVVVMVSGRTDTEKLLVEEAFRLGVNSRGHCISYLVKYIPSDVLLRHAREALDYARRWGRRKQRERQMIQLLLERITPAEWFVMEGVLAGKSSRQIAEERLELQKDADRFKADRLLMAARNVDQQRNQIHNRKDKLAEWGFRIDDYDALLDDRFGGLPTKSHRALLDDRSDGLRAQAYGALAGDRFGALLDLATAEIEMRRSLLTIEQADALQAAEQSGAKQEVSPLLAAALERVLAPDLRTWMRWVDKLVDIKENRTVSKPPPKPGSPDPPRLPPDIFGRTPTNRAAEPPETPDK